MDEAIISRATIRQRGADAFNAGRSRESHNMNPGSAAIADWLDGFNQAQRQDGCAFFRKQAEVMVAEVSPP